ncbi:MAG: calcium/sodium antiporter [Pseudomonadota bacterium]
MLIDFFLVAVGLVLLTLGADWLVRAVVTVAQRLNISTLLVSLTIVALGTSLPEFFVVIQAQIEDAPGIGMGNIVGSNIANLLLILGFGATLRPLATERGTLARDGLAMLIGTAIFVAGTSTGLITPWIGALFVVLLISYFAFCVMKDGGVEADDDALELGPALAVLVALGGLAALIVGSDLLVRGGVSLARTLGVGETVIGLTLVAVGTSLPELATTLAAVRRGHPEVILGGILGSNLFNLLGVIGVAALIKPIPVPEEILRLDVWLMALATIVTLILLRTGWRLDRREGGMMLAAYGAYIAFQFGLFGS